MASEIRAFQIFYNDKTRALLDPDFEPLDNSKNERPDWYEYWPIRTFLSERKLKDSTYYGFLSPEMPLSSAFAGNLPGVMKLDALKVAFSKTGDPHFLRQFKQERSRAFAVVWPGRSPRL